jgi:DNA-binding beta-propeller fold protein YncE
VSVHKSIQKGGCLLLVCSIMLTAAGLQSKAAGQQSSERLSFVRAFSSAEDVKRQHPVLDRTLDIIAGPKQPEPRVTTLYAPSAVASDSKQRIFVADPGARAVHIFNFNHYKYSLLDGGSERLGVPVALAVDGHDNVYVIDASSDTVLVYNSAGKFRNTIGKLKGGESYFESPSGIAIDRITGLIYVCDKHRHMVIVMDDRGRLVAKFGKRGGGSRPGEFRKPTQVAVSGEELFVLDQGNTRLQILDKAGHFRRFIMLVDADPRAGLAVDKGENIYISYPDLARVQVFNHAGESQYTYDLSNVKDWILSRPTSLWVDANYGLYVVDSLNKRVALFQIEKQDRRR